MDLTKFTQTEITQEQFDLLPVGVDIWMSNGEEEWVSIHKDTFVLTISKEFFCAEDNEWRCEPRQMFLLTPINQ
jgi:hypothetical protein